MAIQWNIENKHTFTGTNGNWDFLIMNAVEDFYMAVATADSRVVNVGSYRTLRAAKAACDDLLVALADPTSTISRMITEPVR